MVSYTNSNIPTTTTLVSVFVLLQLQVLLLLLVLSQTTTVVVSFSLISSASRNTNTNRPFIRSKLLPNNPLVFESSSSTPTALRASSSSPQETDLELTRKTILSFLDTSTSNDSNSNTNDDNDKTMTKATTTETTTTNKELPKVLPGYLQRPNNDNMIRVALGERTTTQTPVWLFRQAGRHLPEYHSYKGTKSFLDLLNNPIDVAEVTMQPIRRYNLDAAILFSDILVIIEALGIEISMPGGVGIQVPYPLQHPSDIASRLYNSGIFTSSNTNETKHFVHTKLKHVFDAITLIRQQMIIENKSIPLIGFSAAPFTLLYYMIGGSSKKNIDIGTEWLTKYPIESQQLLSSLTNIIIEYLSYQIEYGVHIIQVFEAMSMMLSEELFIQYAIPCIETIGIELQKRYKDKHIPIMIFTRGACTPNVLTKLQQLECYNVITIDGTVDSSTIRSEIQGSEVQVQQQPVVLQGNYNPNELIVDNNKSIETVQEMVQQYLTNLTPYNLIANLGEGLGGKESTVLVNEFINSIHTISSQMITNDQK